MNGRYGGDQLSVALLILTVILNLIGQLGRIPLLIYIAYIPLFISLFRTFSTNITRRRMENYKFSMLISPVYSWLLNTKKRLADSKTHRYFKCPNCRTQLRVPRGKGKIVITCPRCKTQFKAKT